MKSDWQIRILKDLADIRVSNVDKKIYPKETPVKLCNYMDVYGNDYITNTINFMVGSATDIEMERFSLQPGDVIITKDSETPDDIGIPSVVVENIKNLVCGYHLCLIRPKLCEIEPVYLAKQLGTSAVAKYFAINASGSTRFGLPIGAIEKLEINVAPLSEQTKIAEVLSKVDQAIEQTENLIAKQQRIKSGLMQDLLTGGIDENGNLRSEETHEFKDSPLGRIPVEWDVCNLGAVTTKIADRNHTTPKYFDDGVLMISPMAFYNDESIDFEKCPYISRKAHLVNMEKTDCSPGDIILHRIGAGLGRVRVVLDDHPEYSLLHSLALVRPEYSRVTTSFLKWYFRSFALQVQMGLGTQSIGVPDLGLDKISMLQFGIPCRVEEQIKIGSILDNQQKTIDKLFNSKIKLQKLKTALMQDLLSEDVRVTPLLENMEAYT